MIYIQQDKHGEFHIDAFIGNKAYLGANPYNLKEAIHELSAEINKEDYEYKVIATLNSPDELANLEDIHPELFL